MMVLGYKLCEWMKYIHDASSDKEKIGHLTVQDLEMQNRIAFGYGFGCTCRQNRVRCIN